MTRHLCHEIAPWQPTKRPDLRCHRFDDASSEVTTTACRCAKSQAAEVCPTSASSGSDELVEVDATESTNESCFVHSVCLTEANYGEL